MRKIFLLVAMFSLTLLVSCGGGNGPDAVTKKFLEAVNTGEFEEAKKYCDDKTASLLGMMGGLMTEEQKEEAKKNKQAIEIVKTEEKDDKATVTYKVGDEAEKTLKLVKVKDEWKVSIDKEDSNKEGMGAPKMEMPSEDEIPAEEAPSVE